MNTAYQITDCQQEILKFIPSNISKDDIKAIKRLLTKYFADRAGEEADKLWDEKGFKTAKDIESYLSE
ncbi:MAG TPA: hypothetical protein PK385_04065 [Spirochaetota bacterium]|nr:hypothetical protein [Spirochaetota bacterium]HOS33289.1 hypothetical protein [Spirochaetota bacterium]HOS55214.1 hypothetical protein [Spirochaetota bacterium]HPK62819.1 hypothetical protein [Spirochaetota bacterium]HQF78567.1 hypothetical protein [Spirochaetota bacterium]